MLRIFAVILSLLHVTILDESEVNNVLRQYIILNH